MILTNGTYTNQPPYELRKFILIAEYESYMWVKALNGNYVGELLTFPSNTLEEVK